MFAGVWCAGEGWGGCNYYRPAALDTGYNQKPTFEKRESPHMSPAARATCPAAGDGRSHAAGDSGHVCPPHNQSRCYPRLVKTLGCCCCVLPWRSPGPPLADTDEGPGGQGGHLKITRQLTEERRYKYLASSVLQFLKVF